MSHRCKKGISVPILLAIAMVCLAPAAQSQTDTWNGAGANSNWSTVANWSLGSAPANSSSSQVIFGGTTDLTPNMDANWSVNSITFKAGAGAFSLSSAGDEGLTTYGGGITNNSSNTQSLLVQITTAANQTWTANTGALSFSNIVTFGSNILTIAGASNSTFNNQVVGSGSLVTSQSGTATFNGQVNNSSGTVSVTGTGPTVFNGQVTSDGGFSTSGSGSVSVTNSLQLGSGNLTLGGSGTTNLTGAAINAGNISITGTGNQTISSVVNSSSFSQSGSGTTTISGSASNFPGTTTITGGKVVLANTSGNALGSAVTVSGSGDLVFGANNQLPSYANVTLGTGGTLNLNGTSQTLNSLTVTGNSVIDFGSSASLTLSNLDLTGSSTLTVEGWTGSTDSFDASLNPGSSSLASVVFEPGNQTATWGSGSITPTPEPRLYGILCVGFSLGALVLLRSGRKNAAILPITDRSDVTIPPASRVQLG
jgi:fibronectin-binding autotransporter adhesin